MRLMKLIDYEIIDSRFNGFSFHFRVVVPAPNDFIFSYLHCGHQRREQKITAVNGDNEKL